MPERYTSVYVYYTKPVIIKDMPCATITSLLYRTNNISVYFLQAGTGNNFTHVRYDGYYSVHVLLLSIISYLMLNRKGIVLEILTLHVKTALKKSVTYLRGLCVFMLFAVYMSRNLSERYVAFSTRIRICKIPRVYVILPEGLVAMYILYL